MIGQTLPAGLPAVRTAGAGGWEAGVWPRAANEAVRAARRACPVGLFSYRVRGFSVGTGEGNPRPHRNCTHTGKIWVLPCVSRGSRATRVALVPPPSLWRDDG